MLDGIERIEVALRTEIGLLLGRISPTAHRDAACLTTINPGTTWGVRLRELMDSFPSVSSISIRHMGFPSNWQQHPLWP